MSDSKALLCPEKTAADEPRIILFVCTGNTCRSPMASALFNHLYSDGMVRAESAGLAALGDPISENAKAALMERGVLPTPSNNYLNHISRLLTEELLDKADTVVALTGAHAMNIIMKHPLYASKVAVMPSDISDPYGGSLETYRRCLADIESALAAAFGEGECDDGARETENE